MVAIKIMVEKEISLVKLIIRIIRKMEMLNFIVKEGN